MFTRVNNDIFGNPRYVCHFHEFINDADDDLINRLLLHAKVRGKECYKIDIEYKLALKRAKKLGGRKFHNKQFDGGIVFQTCDTNKLKKQIEDLLNNFKNNLKYFENCLQLSKIKCVYLYQITIKK